MKDDYYLDPRTAEGYDVDIQPARDIVRDDIPYYLGLAKEAAASGQSVLELGCGTGRVTLPIAEAGVPILGIDRSREMLKVARLKALGQPNPRWLEADMTDFHLEERFGLVIIPFRSFLLLLTTEEQKACLRCVHEHLVEGGRLALNFFNPDIVRAAGFLQRRGSLGKETDASGKVLFYSRDYRPGTQQFVEREVDAEFNDEGGIVVKAERNLRLRYVFRYEMEHLLALSGFEVEALYGWFDRRPFDADSSEMVWLARKA